MTTISPKHRSRFWIVLFFAACVVVLAVLLRNNMSNFFWNAASPVMAFRNSLDTNEVSTLRAELASTTAALADRNALYAENINLKQLLGRTVSNHSVLAAVLQKPPSIPYDTLIIDIGRQDNVAPGDLVFAGGTLAIGTVSEVYDTTSRVTLLSSPGETYDALLNGSVPVSLTGQGDGSMSGEVPAGTPVKAGDSIVLPGIGSSFVGSVSHVSEEAGSSFITLYVQLPVNLFSLQYIEVQTNP
ncbi:MAG TPA: rod shape-determining protein MreC [Candidatus Paceibacterota bacterium]|nr:rod shape-determining protein MreC [Candidatus Paceibacterota bacterium]